jgi:hypothetical protein
MRFRFEHVPDLDAQKLLDKLVARGFLGAVHRVDLPEADQAVIVDVMDDARSEEAYKVVREVAATEGLVPHETTPEEDVVKCWRRK